ncbi:Zinc finger SWIM domain-containing protein 7, variant 2 [Basidiobolus ranarum]|uniref:Zinc finger SWIM domain-containing protein 7, variant 2 n=1 Tax=Basidiobolus ranarum TaxID=34480 RepID=A0ABR2WNC7_9FUNG
MSTSHKQVFSFHQEFSDAILGRIGETQTITDENLVALYTLYKDVLLDALRLIDNNAIKKMVCPSKRKLYQIADPEADEPVLYEYCTCSAFLREGTVSRLIGLFLSEYCYSCKFFKVVIYKRNTLVSLFFNPFR